MSAAAVLRAAVAVRRLRTAVAVPAVPAVVVAAVVVPTLPLVAAASAAPAACRRVEGELRSVATEAHLGISFHSVRWGRTGSALDPVNTSHHRVDALRT
jgi:hypothetical protein